MQILMSLGGMALILLIAIVSVVGPKVDPPACSAVGLCVAGRARCIGALCADGAK